MKKNIFTFLIFFIFLGFGANPTIAAQSNNMAHHDHAAMDHSMESVRGDIHGEDLKDVIPAIQPKENGKHAHHGKPKEKNSCEHHTTCPSDHVCSAKAHQCSTENTTPVKYQTCSISSECGGGLPWQAAVSPTHDQECILKLPFFQNLKSSSYFLPPLVEASLAGFPGGLERPPQFFS